MEIPWWTVHQLHFIHGISKDFLRQPASRSFISYLWHSETNLGRLLANAIMKMAGGRAHAQGAPLGRKLHVQI